MEVDLEKFRRDGYLIVPNVVPSEQLAELRLVVELMVDREKAQAVAEDSDAELPGGAWYQNPQPRLDLNSIDAQSAGVVDFCLGETVYGVSKQLMPAPAIALTCFGALCSGLIDYGYTDWHRDASSAEQAPLSGMQFDLMENGPGYLQWNIALYEDDVFWVLPGSHKQPTNEAQRRQLLMDPKVPLAGSVAVELGPGDGVVYPNLMMHWGSKYTSKLRRTIHMGFRSFGSDIFPYLHQLDWYHDDNFLQYMSAAAQAHFAASAVYYKRERDQVEAIFRALIKGDRQTFKTQLEKLHPGLKGRMVSVVLLCRIAQKIILLQRPDIAQMSVVERRPLIDGSPPAYYSEDLAQRFTVSDSVILERQFARLHERLCHDAERVHQRYANLYAQLEPDALTAPNFEARPLRTFNNAMPEGFDLDDFIQSWQQ